MTRLVPDQIINIPSELQRYDRELIAKTGLNLRELAAGAADCDLARYSPAEQRVMVIPISSGQGQIAGFSEAIAAIATYLGFQTVVGPSDLSGLVEAYRSGADLVIMADDRVYTAINLHKMTVADNDWATALGFTAALTRMAGGLQNKEVLLIGAGRVGRSAAKVLDQAGAKLVICDRDLARAHQVAADLSRLSGQVPEVVSEPAAVLPAVKLIFDASPAAALITRAMVTEETIVVAPGIPFGLTDQASALVKENLIHDPLQIGTAVMLFAALCGNNTDLSGVPADEQ